jgi:hypothetical protein
MSETPTDLRAVLLDKFRQMNAREAFSLPLRWLHGELLAGLDEVGRAAYQAAAGQLVEEGLVRRLPGPKGETLSLTAAGVEAIYPEPDPERIRRGVLAKFAAMGAKEGYVLPEMWLQHEYEPSLNPKEQAIYQDTLRDMASEGLVEYVARPVPNLRITARGLEAIAQG